MLADIIGSLLGGIDIGEKCLKLILVPLMAICSASFLFLGYHLVSPLVLAEKNIIAVFFFGLVFVALAAVCAIYAVKFAKGSRTNAKT